MIFFREGAGKAVFIISLSVMAVALTGRSQAQTPDNLLVGFSSTGEVPADIFVDTENEKPWLTRPKPRKRVQPEPGRDSAVEALNQQIQTLRQQTGSLEKEKQSLAGQAERLEKEKQSLTAQMAADAQRIASLEQALDDAHRERQAYEKKVQAGDSLRVSGLAGELAATRRELARLQSSQETMRTELAQANRQARVADEQKKTIQTLTASLAESEKTAQTYRQQADTLTGDLKGLREQAALTEAELKTTQTALSTLRQQGTAQSEKARQAEETIQALNKEKASQVAAAREATEQAQAQIAALKAELKTAETSQATVKTVRPESREEKMAYANGVAFANTLVRSMRLQKDLGVEMPQEMILAGLNDAFGRRVQMDSATMTALVEELDKKLNTRIADRQAKEKDLRDKQSATGKTFYQQYAQRKTVRKLQDVLYDIKNSGKGEALKATDQVDILLTGRLPDGTLFDDSGSKNKVQRVRLDSLLPALTDVLTKLRPGGHIEVVLPPSRAFGEEGVPGLIPGDATLVFDINVLRKVK
ncbi:FKBP-type peptidyl-prolyl cis-trans isomerase [Salmonella enterica]|nr:FKBP-type peptidyl-prolyl cis-trans isomerase [Salmonella enterica]